MATKHTITGSIKDLVGEINVKDLVAVVSTNLEQSWVIDSDTGTMHVGDGPVDIAHDGTFSLSLLPSDSADLNVTGIRYWLNLSFQRSLPAVSGGRPGRETVQLGPFAVTGDAEFKDLVDQFDTPATSPVWRDQALADMNAAKSAALGEVATAQGAAVAEVNGQVAVAQSAATSAAASASTAAAIALGEAETALAEQIGDPETLIGSRLNAAIGARVPEILAEDETVVLAASAAVAAAIYTEHPSANLYNPADPDVQTGYLISGGAGNTTASANYTTTGWIPVAVGDEISVSAHRCMAFVQANKTTQAAALVNTGNNATTATYTVPAGAAYARISYNHPTYPTLMVNVGPTLLPYVPFGDSIVVDPDFAAAVGEAIPVPPAPMPVTVTKTGASVMLSSDLGGKTLAQPFNLTGSPNGTFTFATTTLDGSAVHPNSDDITPIRTQMGTLGAGHGHTCVRAFTNPDGKTDEDLGSVWTDGTREHVLLAIDGTGKLIMGGSHTVTGGVVTSVNVAPTANLTHVSGATHTGAIDYTTLTTTQLYPSVGRVSVGLYVDGIPVTADGTLKASMVEVRESYEILDYASLYDTAKANTGVPIAARPIDGAVRITNRYTFRGAECRVSASMTEMKPTTLATCGGVQAAWLSKTGATLTRYLPGAGTAGGLDWANGVDMTSYSTTVNVKVSDLPAGGVAPALSVETLTESGSVLIGFALGYLPFGARPDDASRSSQRATRAANNLWDMRSTKKQYPNFTSAEVAGWGRLTIEGVRRYLTPNEVARVVASRTNAVSAAAALTYA